MSAYQITDLVKSFKDAKLKFTNEVDTGDVLQVYIDYDNNHITIKKAGTDTIDRINYINL
jgi:hypothetical protein